MDKDTRMDYINCIRQALSCSPQIAVKLFTAWSGTTAIKPGEREFKRNTFNLCRLIALTVPQKNDLEARASAEIRCTVSYAFDTSISSVDYHF